MKKALIQGLSLLAVVGAVWLGLSQIDFMRVFKVNHRTESTEDKLGDLFWKNIRNSETVITNDSVNKYVQRIVDRIGEKNGFDTENIKLHIIQKDDINAFAMPGDHMIVFSGLITECTTESELAGVIGHEMAHIKNRHVMKKLVKELGLTVLLSMTTGGSGETIQEAARILSSSAYDRSMETEADFASVDYMIEADINPAPFADFLYKMSAGGEMPSEMYWISTHPESQERAEAIVEYISDRKFETKPILTKVEWEYLKKKSAQ
jgi:predicted Zn-dependent protease